MDRRVAVFSDASTDIFLRKAEADTMMSAMINSPAGKFPARASDVCAVNFPHRLHPAEGEIFLFESPVTH
jgi:hypothetical protein